MEIVWWLLATLASSVLAIWFVVYPRIISDATWYGFFSERMYLYAFPPFFAAAAFYSMREASRTFGLPWADWFAQTTIGVTGLLMILGLLAALGMPVPPLLTPKWVRERRKQDRDERRRRREAKKAGATDG